MTFEELPSLVPNTRKHESITYGVKDGAESSSIYDSPTHSFTHSLTYSPVYLPTYQRNRVSSTFIVR